MLPGVLPPELGAFRNEPGQTRRCLNHLNHQHHATPHNGKSWLHTARCCWRWEGEGEAIFSVCDTCVEPVGSHWVAVRWPVWVQLGSVSECAIGVTRMFGGPAVELLWLLPRREWLSSRLHERVHNDSGKQGCEPQKDVSLCARAK